MEREASVSQSASIYGLMAEFDDPHDLVEATAKTTDAGYKCVDAFAPFPVDGLSDALKLKPSKVSLCVLIAGLCGCAGGFALLYYCSVIAYPINIGGRPLNTFPMWIPIMFECTVLCGGLTSAISMILLNGLPLPHHPVFNLKRFVDNASTDKFYLCVESADEKFDLEQTKAFLLNLHPRGVYEVEN
jgi:Protein of unknown function (DUF3341)